MQNLASRLQLRPTASFALVVPKFLHEEAVRQLQSHIDAEVLWIDDTFSRGAKAFLDRHAVSYPKSASIPRLAELVAKWCLEHNKHLAIVLDMPLHTNKERGIAKGLVTLYNAMCEYPRIPTPPYSIYPLPICSQQDIEFLRKIDPQMWRYKPYFCDLDVDLDVRVLIDENYECYRCKQHTTVLAGVFIGDNKVSLVPQDFTPELIETIGRYFDLEKIVFKSDTEVVQYCSNCGAKQGNFFLYKEIYLECARDSSFIRSLDTRKIPYRELRGRIYK